jgi:hypothetical protein
MSVGNPPLDRQYLLSASENLESRQNKRILPDPQKCDFLKTRQSPETICQLPFRDLK